MRINSRAEGRRQRAEGKRKKRKERPRAGGSRTAPTIAGHGSPCAYGNPPRTGAAPRAGPYSVHRAADFEGQGSRTLLRLPSGGLRRAREQGPTPSAERRTSKGKGAGPYCARRAADFGGQGQAARQARDWPFLEWAVGQTASHGQLTVAPSTGSGLQAHGGCHCVWT